MADGKAFVHSTKCVLLLVAADDALGFVCPRWTTADGVETKPNVHRLKGENNCTVARRWFAVASFESSMSSVYAVLASSAVYPLTAELAWPYQLLYLRKFFS